MSKPLRKCRVCGLEAWIEKDLELFVKRVKQPHGRDNQCKSCYSQHLRKTKPPYLRKCRYCGIEARTNEELELFTKRKNAPYGRHTICKKCQNINNIKNRHKNPTSDTRRRKRLEIIKCLPKPVLCYFCGDEIVKLFGFGSDALHLHSLDGNHENWNPENKVPTHHRCHTKHHISGDKNPRRKASLKKK